MQEGENSMRSRHAGRVRRGTTIGLLSIAGLLFAAAPAQALARKHGARRGRSAAKNVCVASYKAYSERMKSGQLIEAKEFLGKCARATCGPVVMKECTRLYASLDAGIPSVVPVVTDASGVPKPVAEGKVEVKMDGASLTSKVDGKAILINPGEHEFTFSTDTGVFATQKLSIELGQQNRPVSASLQLPGEEADTPSRSGDLRAARSPDSSGGRLGLGGSAAQSWPMYALAGGAVLSLGTAALLTTWGRKDNSDLMNSCGMNCNPSSVHHIRMLYMTADVFLGVGVVALAGATWLYVSSHPTREKASSRGMALKLFDVKPTSSGAVATLGGAF